MYTQCIYRQGGKIHLLRVSIYSRERLSTLESQLHMREDELATCAIKLSMTEQKCTQLDLALQNETRLVMHIITYMYDIMCVSELAWNMETTSIHIVTVRPHELVAAIIIVYLMIIILIFQQTRQCKWHINSCSRWQCLK